MNKIERQHQIKQIIQAEHIGTQEDIKKALQKKVLSSLKPPYRVI